VTGDGPRGPVGGELAILRYAFTGWRTQATDPPHGVAFAGHRRAAYPAILVAVIMAVMAETAAVHLLISLWRPPVAWVFTALSLYSLIWILGDFNAARQEQSAVTRDGLRLRTGLRWRLDLTWAQVVGLQDTPPAGESLTMTLFGEPDFWIECHEPVVVSGMFGMKREVRFIGLGVDDPRGFREAFQRYAPGP